MYLFAAMFGLGLGLEYLIIPRMAAELFGVAVLGRVMGLIVTADGMAEAVSPMLVGCLRDATRSCRVGVAMLVAVALVGAGAIARIPAAPGKRPAGDCRSTGGDDEPGAAWPPLVFTISSARDARSIRGISPGITMRGRQ